MRATFHPGAARRLALLAVLTLAACDGRAPVDPGLAPGDRSLHVGRPEHSVEHRDIAELRRATARYHQVAAALADGYQRVEACEHVPGEGAAGAVYANFAFVDGSIDPSHPEALLYDPADDGTLELVGVELAIPIALWGGDEPPEFAGVTLEPEGEIYGVHVWIWRHNPEGMFASAHPGVTC